jgi:hypothetical protein
VAFVLDLGISMSLNSCPCKAFAKNAQNTRKKYDLWTALLMVCAAIFFVFVSFLGHAAVRLCLPDLGLYVGPLWAMSAPYWAHAGPSWAILGYVSAFVLDLGISVSLNFRPRNGFEKNTINTKEETPYWAHVEPSWAILGSVSAFVLDLGISVWLNFRPCNAAMLA